MTPQASRRTAAYRYELPSESIATTPADPADAARLMDLSGTTLEHRTFIDFSSLLRADDVLVINETRVIRARLRGTREPGGGAAEILLLRPTAGAAFDAEARAWQALVKPGRHLRQGSRIRFGAEASAEIVAVRADGTRDIRFDSALPLPELLERFGELPLPPYVGPGDAARAARYQTIFARVPGSVAAPTASLHFTPRVLEAIRARGTTIVPLVLDVGLATFKPMDGDTIDEHVMHAERYEIGEAAAHTINAARAAGRRIVVAGTTSLRALEASAATDGRVVAGAAETSIFITPGFRFRIADALLTNFHLPGSTLLVLVAAFGGYERVMAAYRTAIANRYRFFSFGDAMFVERLDLNIT
ncbi:MAG: tRNA preQ1(34) S-adenosylmethionine ribosyltransferase-isomerase QueA [Candidatus Eremiobacteraeota bacterium]|nr:tRNA preQ1(34) S-adenosylmethionine ribosyltransferase-isomerase QueA [Candidatus Eremiobacteraeota bacterium]